MRCDLVICIDCGPAYELKWCPLPSPSAQTAFAGPKKLGLLAGTFEDGSFAIFAIPDPKDIAPPNHDYSEPHHSEFLLRCWFIIAQHAAVRLPDPVLRIEMEETCCWSIDWANSEVVAIGMTNGESPRQSTKLKC